MTEHTDEALWRRQYQLLPGLHRKYPTVDDYISYARADGAPPAPVIRPGATCAAAPPAPATPPARAPAQSETTADGWRAEYLASPALQAEFISAEHYIAFRLAESKGLVRFQGRPGVGREAAAVATPPAPMTQRTATPATSTPARAPGAIPTPDAIAAEYNASADLQREFHTLAAYSAWRRNAAAGRARVTTGKVVTA